MLALVFAVIFVLAGVALYLTLRSESYSVWFLVGGVAIAAVITLLASFRIVPPGHRGVMVHLGSVDDDTLGEGFYAVTPFFTNVEEIEVRTQKTVFSASAASADLQHVKTEVALNYAVAPGSVGTLFRDVGLEYRERVIDPSVHEAVKAATARYKAEDLIQKRPDVKEAVEAALRERLGSYGIVVEAVSITDFSFSADFDRAVEAKQVVEQQTKQQAYLVEKARLQKETEITLAQGSAEASRITAEALKTNGGSLVIMQAWIEKWDGHLPRFMGGDGGVMLDVSALMASAPGSDSAPPAPSRMPWEAP